MRQPTPTTHRGGPPARGASACTKTATSGSLACRPVCMPRGADTGALFLGASKGWASTAQRACTASCSTTPEPGPLYLFLRPSKAGLRQGHGRSVLLPARAELRLMCSSTQAKKKRGKKNLSCAGCCGGPSATRRPRPHVLTVHGHAASLATTLFRLRFGNAPLPAGTAPFSPFTSNPLAGWYELQLSSRARLGDSAWTVAALDAHTDRVRCGSAKSGPWQGRA